MAKKDLAIRKRQQIAKANRMMFFWVAGVSAVVGIALVLSVILIQKLVFNEKVLAAKSDTASTLQKNNKAIVELKNQIRVLNTDQALIDSKAKPDDAPIQAVLDALPAEANSAALGASLQEKLIKADNISLDSFTVDAVAGVESDSGEDASAAPVSLDTTAGSTSNQVNFRFTVTSTDVNALRDMLTRLERSIRVIDVTSLSLETQRDKFALTVEAHGYYEPAKTVDLKDKVIKP